MTSQLRISVTFLDTLFHGRSDGAEPEWPPSPLRLFQAIVAAISRHDESAIAQFDAALHWLEAQPAPVIVAPPARRSQLYRLSVPNNAMDIVTRAWARGNESGKDANVATHKAMKTVQATAMVEGSSVHYLWPLPGALAAEAREIIGALAFAAKSIVALGWGVDMAVGCAKIISECESLQLSGERWLPALRGGGTHLRLAVPGTLEALRRRHREFLTRVRPDGGFAPVASLAAFRRVAYVRDGDQCGRPSVAFGLRHPTEQRFRAFRATQTAEVAAMVRHAVAEVAKVTDHTEAGFSSAQWLDQYVHGHERTAETRLGRFAYLPLPTIDPRLVVSGVRRVLIAESADGLGQHAAWARRVVAGHPLVNEKTGRSEAHLAITQENDAVVRHYVSRSRDWATVTPVVLPWGDSGKPHRAEKQFLKALRHAGYLADDLGDLELRREPFWRGADLARRYFLPKRLCGTASYHVRLRWKRDFEGPLALGSGRFCGLGLFAAVSG